MGVELSPSTVLDTSDPGDDTLERYKYQCSVAAINCIHMLLGKNGIVRIICENFEDIIIECEDAQFIGLQVKTKRFDLDPIKSTDESVVKSLSRFCLLDKTFPERFKKFDFLTNHRFWQESENQKNLPWLLEKIKKRGSVKGLPKKNATRIFVNLICEKSGIGEDEVVATLLKTVANAHSEPVGTISHRVIEAVSLHPNTCNLSLSQCAKVAENLVGIVFQASSKKLDGAVTEQYAAGAEFDKILEAHTLAGKCVTKELAESALTPASSQSEPLELASLVPISSLPTHLAVMVQKLDKGGLQAARIEEMSDLVKTFEALIVRWIKRYGSLQAEERYQTLLATVKFECTEAQVACEDPDTQYAPQMYEHLLKSLRERVAQAHEEFHGCRVEHLMGAAGMLTEQCKAWWSPKFEVERST